MGHLDTSIGLQLLKETGKAGAVTKVLAQFPRITSSSYARFEYKRSWIRDLVYLLEMSYRAKSVSDLMGILEASLPNPFHVRRMRRMLQAVHGFVSRITAPQLTVNDELERTRSAIRNAILCADPIWDRSIAKEFDGVCCARARVKAKVYPDGRVELRIPHCSRNNPPCKINEFFVANAENFVGIAIRVEADLEATEQMKGAARVVRVAERDPGTLINNQICAKIGDLIIGIDSGDSDPLLANNDRDWRIVADVIGKSLLNPTVDSKTGGSDAALD